MPSRPITHHSERDGAYIHRIWQPAYQSIGAEIADPVKAQAWQLLVKMAFLIRRSQWQTKGVEVNQCPQCSNFPQGEQGLGSGHSEFCDYRIILTKLVEVGL